MQKVTSIAFGVHAILRFRPSGLANRLVCIAVLSVGCLPAFINAQSSGSKADLSPAFWQRDPVANFEDEGRQHCAPTSVSGGLIYLSKAMGFKGLVPGTDHKSQIKLIEELAEDFDTDPSVGGTNPNKILTGLQEFMERRGFELKRLELKSWRPVGADNKEFKLGTKPDMAWMRSAVHAKDTVVIFNFGWYKETEDGWKRDSGHWINVIGVKGNDFVVRNPILQPEKQLENSVLTLELIDEDFIVPNDSGEANMKGYYEGDGSGLPHGKSVTPILDAVIVFRIERVAKTADKE